MLLNVIKEKGLADYNFAPFTRAAKDGPRTGAGAGAEVRPSSTAAPPVSCACAPPLVSDWLRDPARGLLRNDRHRFLRPMTACAASLSPLGRRVSRRPTARGATFLSRGLDPAMGTTGSVGSGEMP
jgi:hypothetical protein